MSPVKRPMVRYNRVFTWECQKCRLRVPIEFMGRVFCLRCEAKEAK